MGYLTVFKIKGEIGQPFACDLNDKQKQARISYLESMIDNISYCMQATCVYLKDNLNTEKDFFSKYSSNMTAFEHIKGAIKHYVSLCQELWVLNLGFEYEDGEKLYTAWGWNKENTSNEDTDLDNAMRNLYTSTAYDVLLSIQKKDEDEYFVLDELREAVYELTSIAFVAYLRNHPEIAEEYDSQRNIIQSSETYEDVES